MALSARLLALRRSPILLKLPPYLSALCLILGVAWLLLLPRNEYSRQTYVSENAILPGQVHTYFGGSEHNAFRAYRQEVFHLAEKSEPERNECLERILKENGLKTATQEYRYTVAGDVINGTNVYGILQGPRADATEAMVLIAGYRNFDNEINYSGLALVLTLARYFSRWSIWSKDIIVLIPTDSSYGTEAWVSAYHSTTTAPTASRNISSLRLKAGALQAAVALDYPAGPWGHRFEKLDVLYDGINGALPNLDLLNTAISIASGQMGIPCTLHNLLNHRDTYTDRLHTLFTGILTQGAGHATGPHSAFMPYHIDAITLKTVGDGWHDEMTLGRTTESLFRSINNLLEHLHQSFFFYMLLNANRFVSIGSYLPSAMLLAGSFTVTAMAMWAKSGSKLAGAPMRSIGVGEKEVHVEMEVVKDGGDVAVVPKVDMEMAERKMFLPAVVVLGAHLLGSVTLYLLNSMHHTNLSIYFALIIGASAILPANVAWRLTNAKVTPQQLHVLQSFSLLLVGAILSTLATLNFSLALIIGILAWPLNFVGLLPISIESSFFTPAAVAAAAAYGAVAPPTVIAAVAWYLGRDMNGVLLGMAKGWIAQGVWTSFVVWGFWWPAWMLGAVVMWSGMLRRQS